MPKTAFKFEPKNRGSTAVKIIVVAENTEDAWRRLLLTHFFDLAMKVPDEKTGIKRLKGRFKLVTPAENALALQTSVAVKKATRKIDRPRNRGRKEC